MSVIVDADDYFRHARQAMLNAKKRIMLIGWDFDARISLVTAGLEEGEPKTIGEFIYWLVKRTPGLEVFLLRWDIGAIKAITRGTTLFTVLKWMRHPRIFAKLDGAHPKGSSHHQKIMAIDDCFAFCGGIDVTAARWDTRQHLDDDPGRMQPNGQPYKPWHDVTSAVQGPVAAALAELARDRWQSAGGKMLEPVSGVTDCWPNDLAPDFVGVDVGIARTVPAMPGRPEVREIEDLFVAQIANAKVSIYAESQYFASRRIAEAIARRLSEPDCPEIVLINPLVAEGWLQPLAMDTARARLVAALRHRDQHGRFRIYHPFTEAGDPIYVHAKVMIIDGQILRVGSANMNNRSLGLDTECDVVIEAAADQESDAVRRIRDCLIAEHLGQDEAQVRAAIQEHGSIIGAIEASGVTGRSLRPYEIPDLSEVEKWLADNEVLDPESPSEMFESIEKRGLFRYLHRPSYR